MNQPLGKFETPVTPGAKRGNDRDSLLLKAILRFQSSEEDREVRIRNLSSGGLMAEAPVRVSRGEKIEVNLRNIGWISGHVAWVAEGRLGIAFDHAIDPKEARKPASTEHELPHYLKKLNAQQAAKQKDIRRV